MHTIIETPEFIRCIKKLGVKNDELREIIDTIAANPQLGDEISGTGGARKIRFSSKQKGSGKSSGYRVITFYSGKDIPVFLLSAYEKGQKDDMTHVEKQVLKITLKHLVTIYKKGIRSHE